MKGFLSIVLVYIFGIVFAFMMCDRAQEMDNNTNLVQNYTINSEISNN